MRFTSKTDYIGKVIGLEQYKPGSPTAQGLGIHITSGTTAGDITMIIWRYVTLPFRWGIWETELNAFLRCIGKNAPNLTATLRVMAHTKTDRVLCLDRKDMEHPDIEKLLLDFSPTEMYAYVSSLDALLSRIKSLTDTALKRVRIIGTVSDMLTPRMERRIRESMPVAEVRSNYAMAESDWLVNACAALSERYPDMRHNVYHILPGREITIADAGADGLGEIAITTAELSNYKTGDAGKIVDEPCACGARQTLIVYGRKDYDIVHCAGATFLRSHLERCMAAFDDLIEDYRVTIEEKDGPVSDTKGLVTFLIVPSKADTPDEQLQSIAQDVAGCLFVTKTRTLAQLVEDGVFFEPAVRRVSAIESTSHKKIRLQKLV